MLLFLQSAEVFYTIFQSIMPVPSAGILKSNKRKSDRKVETKNSGTEAISSRNSCGQTSKSEEKGKVGLGSNHQSSSNARKRKISSPTIQIGKERSKKAETGDAHKKVRYRLHNINKRRCTQHRKSDKGNFPILNHYILIVLSRHRYHFNFQNLEPPCCKVNVQAHRYQ